MYYDNYSFVPVLDFTQEWTDEKLFDEFGLNQQERDYINKMIAPLSVNSDEEIEEATY